MHNVMFDDRAISLLFLSCLLLADVRHRDCFSFGGVGE